MSSSSDDQISQAKIESPILHPINEPNKSTELTKCLQPHELPKEVQEMQKQNLSLDTHKNDGPLGLLYHQLIKKETKENLLSFEESIHLINEWLQNSNLPLAR